MTYFTRALLLGLSLFLTERCAWGEGRASNAGEIESIFVVLGDNQLGKELVAPGDASTVNKAQFRQNLKDIAALKPKPSFIFLTGDLVDHGDQEKGHTIADRLEAWTKLYRKTCSEFALKAPLIPNLGNHEMMKVVFEDGKPAEDFNPDSYPAWLKWIERSGFGQFGGNGPSAAAAKDDHLTRDNSRFTYSFDDAHGNHFIIINTFTLNDSPKPLRGWVPYHWIAEDARKAEANRKVKHIFAFGHLPIRINGFPFDPKGENSILNSDTHPLASQLQETLGSLTKFRGYFCGHLHLWDCSPLPDGKSLWQIIAGNAGSKPIKLSTDTWKAPFYFGFTVVRIHKDGGIGVVSYNRPVPDPYYSTAPQPPATPQPEILLPRTKEDSGMKKNQTAPATRSKPN